MNATTNAENALKTDVTGTAKSAAAPTTLVAAGSPTVTGSSSARTATRSAVPKAATETAASSATKPASRTLPKGKRADKPSELGGAEDSKQKAAAKSASLAAPRQTKARTVEALLLRKEGARLSVLCEATGWQAHTCRAFLTGLRKKGRDVRRDQDKEGKSIYRMAPLPKAAR